MQVTRNIIWSLYFPMIMCGVKKYQKKDFIRFSISFHFQYWNYYIDGHDHIRNVSKEKTRINTTSPNVVIVFSDLKVDANRRAAQWKAELWEENRNKIWVQVWWKVLFFIHIYRRITSEKYDCGVSS